MNKLTTEQLLFAHRIGAELVDIEPPIFFYKMEGDKWYYNNLSCDDYKPSIYDNPAYECAAVKPIDFSPLYDWIDHDGGECPVRGDDAVIVDFNEKCGGLYYEHAKGIDWKKVKLFKLTQRLSEWPEQRTDAIGQNGNTGEHYADIPPPEYDPRDVAFKPKKSKYHREVAPGVWIDVYDVLKAWNVTCPALQHLIKKALQPGERGHKTLDQDMKDIVASAIRAQELASNPED